MRFARIAFWIAGIYGLLSLPPLYFLFDYIGRQTPPPITHPHFYYGFVGVSLAFQFVFCIIATDPLRFRPMILPSIIEKLSYMAAVAALYMQGRIMGSEAATALPDTLLCALFVVAWFKTANLSPRASAASSRPPVPMNVRIP